MKLLSVLDILYPPPGPLLIHTRPYLGHHRCDCGLVFWIWPITGLPATEDTGQTGAPDLRPFQPWTCWRQIQRMAPRNAPMPMNRGAAREVH